MQPFPLLCLTLVRTIAVVALTRPPCHRLRRSPKSLRSTAHANVAIARWLQGRRGCPRSGEAVPWGFSAADAWKMVSRYTWESCDRATRGHFCLSLPQVRLLLLLLIVVNRRTRASARRSFTNASNSSPTGGASAADERRYCNGAWH
jgi:hypothetical protein